MRFISKYANYMLNVRKDITEHYATGQSQVVQRPLIAVFDIGIVTPDERALARQRFSFNGFAQEQDLVTVVEPDARISAFDSQLKQQQEEWTDEEREQVERELLKVARILPEDLIVIERVRLSPPWPNYDRFTGDGIRLLERIDEDGYDLADVLAYEQENQNRSEFVYMLQRAIEAASDGVRPGERMPEEELVG